MDANEFGKAFLGEFGLQAGRFDILADAFEDLPFRHPLFETRIKPCLTSNIFDVKSRPVETHAVFLRRLGPDPHANGAQTAAAQGCPDLWELADGNFAIIGIDITDATTGKLPPTAGCGPDERVVLVPRKTLILAKTDIPDRV